MFYVEYYETADGRVPVREFLSMLPPKIREKSIFTLNVLREFGNTLREPYSKYLGDGIFELRIKYSSNAIRIFYFFYVGQKIVITHGFVKKTMKTPGAEKRKAIKYRQDYFNRRRDNYV